MKKIAVMLVLFTLLASHVYADTKTYGKGVHIKDATAVSAILDDPDSFIGKAVRIEGMIIEVCAKRGCWVYVAGDRQGEKIQVKVTDGEIVFPMSSAGRMGVVEGIVEELQVSREEMIKYLQHMAEEKGQPFDPATVENDRLIRLIGIGAEIEN